MGDLVTCKAVLYVGDNFAEYLLLAIDAAREDLRLIPVRPKGTARSGGFAEWEYEHRGGDVLHMMPSLLCPDTGPPPFHTDYDWTVRFERIMDGLDAHERFSALNPKGERP